MALETLKEVGEIGGYRVVHMEQAPDCLNPSEFIQIYNDDNSINFKIQDGPIKEHGVNGCQVDTLIHAAKMIIEGLNKKFPCRENSMAITNLDASILWLEKRKSDREKRGVEGFNKD